ncbi:MAG TPA: hypothetical protein PK781_05985 [Terrimesophilobacter sp.]|nr:hypothetical protein [Terrimesophilobacter sp.]HRP99992.1 hypothetical protein [Terrimesophilobacter sp.]
MTAVPVFKKILLWGGVLAIAIALIGGVVGYLYAGEPGLISALVGTGMAVIFMGITAASVLIAVKAAGEPFNMVVFFGIVMGGWLLKFIVFFVLVIAFRDQPWLNPTVLFLSIVAGVVGSLVVDLVVVAKSRLPYVSDVALPEQIDQQD